MPENLKIALLSPQLPAVDTSACARKIFDFIRFFHKKGHKIYLFSFCRDSDRKHKEKLDPFCSAIYLEYLEDYLRYPKRSSLFSSNLVDLCRKGKIQILQCEKAFMARYLPKNINEPVVLVEHEILSASFFERAHIEKLPFSKISFFLKGFKKIIEEKLWYLKFNKIIAFTNYDKKIIGRSYKEKDIEVIPLSLDANDYPLEKKEKMFDLLFVGNFNHSPNIDAVNYFYSCIFPILKRKLGGVSWAIVGEKLPENIKRYLEKEKNIFILGYVSDIKDVYLKSKILVAPVRFGTGMRLKILEAMAGNLPVIATDVGNRGFEKNGLVITAKSEKDFAQKIIELLLDKARYESICSNLRNLILHNYSLERQLPRYQEIYDSLLNNN